MTRTHKHGRVKRFHSKVITGCRTCKGRRVKCGEEKPICLRCKIGGKDCLYDWMKTEEDDDALDLHLTAISTSTGDEIDKRALLFYREKTAPLYGSDHNSIIAECFNKLILTAAHSNLIIWHLAVALGSRHEAKERSAESTSAPAILASRHYSQALNEFSQQILSLKVDEAVLCCMLMAAYANTTDELPSNAMMHLTFGASILRQSLPQSSPSWQFMSEFLEPLYAHLAMLSGMFSIPAVGTECTYLVSPMFPVLPPKFSNLREAKSYLVDILRWRYWHTIGTHCEEEDDSNIASVIITSKSLMNEWYTLLLAYRNMFIGQERSRASNMLYLFELLCMNSNSSRTSKFLEMANVRIVRVDLSQSSRIDVIFEYEGPPPPPPRQPNNGNQQNPFIDGGVTIWPDSVLIEETQSKTYYRSSHVK